MRRDSSELLNEKKVVYCVSEEKGYGLGNVGKKVMIS